ncbi:hypothetical protein K2173_008970 [Erythroxylum novogranatense]|uniref:NPF family transporter n=1 Tax=Erythroxylum novogranatense TaxID=1862640 RepID=A0AAV8TT00_9ROSI|nr:hypothetical protein K2173_008970 [Erythroxylum novogranatense]
MVISNDPNMFSATVSTPLMEDKIVDGFVDSRGQPASRATSGGWKAACFVIVVEVAERFSYYGVSSNLITYLTGPLGQSTATAAENVNIWFGTGALLPLLEAFIADSLLGRYRSIIVASIIYILGLGLLSFTAVLTSLQVSHLQDIKDAKSQSPGFRVILFFFSIYLVAVGQGGHKPCVQAFGADQFDGQDPKESKEKNSFFNWWYFFSSMGINVSLTVLVYIQENLNWALGFGIPCIMMLAALFVLLLGSRTYRYNVKKSEGNSLMKIGRLIGKAIRNRNATPSAMATEYEAKQYCQTPQQFKFLNKALFEPEGSMEGRNVFTVHDVEQTKSLLRLIPIWVTSLIYAIVFAQTSTVFTKQGATMDRNIFPGFKIPAASLQFFIGIAILLCVPMYDRIFVPVAQSLTGKPSGITMLQRIGFGMVLSTLSMVTAALVEMKRLETAKEYGIIDLPNVTVPISVWWLVPQYLLCGAADVFTIVGLQEFFYDQVPKDLRSMGLSLYLSVIGVGSLLSSLLVSIIDKTTGTDGRDSWFANNLNRAHIDYYYWLLAGLSAVGFTAFLYFARSYVYSRGSIS